MKSIVYSTQFKKDIKRYLKQKEKMAKLYQIVSYLQNEIPIPAENHPHPLSGKWKGFMECHIESDFLLIWIDESTQSIRLIRSGSHSELFK